jgi:hypothetical protein
MTWQREPAGVAVAGSAPASSGTTSAQEPASILRAQL